jgi:hypothetical protein
MGRARSTGAHPVSHLGLSSKSRYLKQQFCPRQGSVTTCLPNTYLIELCHYLRRIRRVIALSSGRAAPHHLAQIGVEVAADLQPYQGDCPL